MNILYKNANHERNNHIQYKDDYTVRDKEFMDKYNNLIKNLDGDSVETINLILKRLNDLFQSKDSELDLFDNSEQEIISSIQEQLYDKIFQIDTDLFAYKNYFLPQKYFDAIVYYYQYGCCKLKTLSKICQGNVIDAGAFIGDSALLFSKMIKGKVYALEALKDNCESIRKTIEVNHVDNIEIINKAVGINSGISYINQNDNKNWSTMSPYESRKYHKVEIEITSIDDLVKEKNLKVSLIKAHVEGMESDMIKGAVNTLKEQRPAILIHIHHTPNDFFYIKPYIESLNLGYKFKVYKPTNGSIYTGTMLIAEMDE